MPREIKSDPRPLSSERRDVLLLQMALALSVLLDAGRIPIPQEVSRELMKQINESIKAMNS